MSDNEIANFSSTERILVRQMLKNMNVWPMNFLAVRLLTVY